MVSPRHGPTDTSLCAAKAPQGRFYGPLIKYHTDIRGCRPKPMSSLRRSARCHRHPHFAASVRSSAALRCPSAPPPRAAVPGSQGLPRAASPRPPRPRSLSSPLSAAFPLPPALPPPSVFVPPVPSLPRFPRLPLPAFPRPASLPRASSPGLRLPPPGLPACPGAAGGLGRGCEPREAERPQGSRGRSIAPRLRHVPPGETEARRERRARRGGGRVRTRSRSPHQASAETRTPRARRPDPGKGLAQDFAQWNPGGAPGPLLLLNPGIQAPPVPTSKDSGLWVPSPLLLLQDPRNPGTLESGPRVPRPCLSVDSRLHRSRVGGRVSAGSPPGPGRAGPRCRRRRRRCQLSILSPPPPPDGLSPSSRRARHPPSLLPDSLRPGPPPGSAGPAPPPGTPPDQPPPQGAPAPAPPHRPAQSGLASTVATAPPRPAPAPELAPVQGKKFHPAPGRRERGGGGSGAGRPGRGA
ncbi:basic proline-rich protein-like [Moschus berezovskii]|uniref:basic proline-rich protein-like n=1 Tax=Moschus berezovskii TaxID=68408 RepID=UPI0024453912|nr:basic proline-rich protein-like [Moschus berezovskii]